MPTSKILRTKPSEPPPSLNVNRNIIQVPVVFAKTNDSVRELCEFWKAYYRAGDWTMNMKESVVREIVGREHTTIIGVRNPEGELVGTVASIQLIGQMYHNEHKLNYPFFLVDYLVLHPQMRNRGVAGWLLGWLDHLTSLRGPCIHCWFRESYYMRSNLSLMTIAPFHRMRTMQISYVSLATRSHPEQVEQISWQSVRSILNDIKEKKEFSFSLMFIPNESIDTTWWRVELLDYPSCALIIGIKNTMRVKSNNRMIYKVVFTCFVRLRPGNVDDIADPFWVDGDSYIPAIRSSIEAAAFTQKCDIITVTNNSSCGDDHLKKWPHWHETNRKLKMFVYNWSGSSGGTIIWPI
jgi:hypothetical protein